MIAIIDYRAGNLTSVQLAVPAYRYERQMESQTWLCIFKRKLADTKTAEAYSPVFAAAAASSCKCPVPLSSSTT